MICCQLGKQKRAGSLPSRHLSFLAFSWRMRTLAPNGSVSMSSEATAWALPCLTRLAHSPSASPGAWTTGTPRCFRTSRQSLVWDEAAAGTEKGENLIACFPKHHRDLTPHASAFTPMPVRSGRLQPAASARFSSCRNTEQNICIQPEPRRPTSHESFLPEEASPPEAFRQTQRPALCHVPGR